MAQFARPTSDISTGFWTGSFADIDESTASDSDFGYSADKEIGDYETKLGTVTDPAVSTGHIVRCRVSKSDGGVPNNTSGSASTVTIAVYEATTLIETLVTAYTLGAWADLSYTLTAAGSITDYSDLRIRYSFVGGAGSPANRRGFALSWAELEVPDVVASTRRISNI